MSAEREDDQGPACAGHKRRVRETEVLSVPQGCPALCHALVATTVIVVVIAGRLVFNPGRFIVGSFERDLASWLTALRTPPPDTHCQTECLEHDSPKAPRFVSEDGI